MLRLIIVLAAALLCASYRYPDSLLRGPAFVAVEDNDLEGLRGCIARGLDVNATNGGFTLVMSAASRGRAETVQTLVELGARLDRVSTSGASALHFAALTGNRDTIAVLTRAGANPNARDTRGTTPLMYAVVTGDRAKVLALLEAGADPTLKNNRGEDAAHIAAELGHLELAALLVEADPR